MSDLLTQPGVILAGVAVAAGVGAYFAMAPGSSSKEDSKTAKKKAPELPKKLKKKKEKEEAAVVNPKPEPVKESEPLDLNEFVGDFPDTDDEEAARAEANRKRNAKKKAAKKKKAANAPEEVEQPKGKKGASVDLISKLDNASSTKKEKKEKKAAAAAAAVDASAAAQVSDASANDDGWETVAYKKRGSKAVASS
ncbi:hypothetical protein AC1031_021091 [Aphanomyces cochlioides]|nr:hypothetical protein AC1031_021091 [Aphanomyces cochlioides]